MRNNIFIFLVAILVTTFTSAQVVSPSINAQAWVLLDSTSDQILASHEGELQIVPASLVKLMTAYLVFSAIRDKKIKLEERVVVRKNILHIDPSSSKMFLQPGAVVTIDKLLQGLIAVSGNDAAIVLAEAISGIEVDFVKEMNAEGLRQGLHHTHFSNSSGLPDVGNYSTARDLAMLAKNIIAEFPSLYSRYFAIKTLTYSGITQSNKNRLLWRDLTVDGVKTGHAKSVGYSLIGSSKRTQSGEERRLISVLIGSESDQVRAQESQKLLNWGFESFQLVRLYDKEQPADFWPIWMGALDKVAVGFNKDIYISIPRKSIATHSFSMHPSLLVAPIQKGSVVGAMEVSVNGLLIKKAPLRALESIGEGSLFSRSWQWLMVQYLTITSGVLYPSSHSMN